MDRTLFYNLYLLCLKSCFFLLIFAFAGCTAYDKIKRIETTRPIDCEQAMAQIEELRSLTWAYGSGN